MIGKFTIISADAEKHIDNVQQCFIIEKNKETMYVRNTAQ